LASVLKYSISNWLIHNRVALLLDPETFFNTNYPAGSQKTGFIGTGTIARNKKTILACAHLIITFI